MGLHTVYASDGESSFQENFIARDGDDVVDVAARHLARAWGVDLTGHDSPAAYAASLLEFEVHPATADQSVLALMDAARAFLEDPRDHGQIGELRRAYVAAVAHRDHYAAAA